jgi:glucose-6-phosphate isomerase, archaeal
MPENGNHPFAYDILQAEKIALSAWDNHISRNLSSMKNQFLDSAAYAAMLAKENCLLYEVYEIRLPEEAGVLLQGISIVHPGKVGDEYFMTKGHFHSVIETAEVYYCLRGSGYMVMETPEGEWAVEPLKPGQILYVPPRWAHRTVNTGPSEDVVTFFVYPGNAGHDYGSIEKQGFRKLVVERDGSPAIIDNPRWLPPEAR